ncbi:MAG: ribosomal RNA small subunit methyltransferase A [Clostridia bacterium]|nr:ribosomal RNA small subunit methyltransferase A [Clostridia bacterium]
MSKTRERIHDSQLKYKQGLGQHFLYDQALLEELVAESGVTAEDDVLEIGPGSGALTQCLCRAARRVVSIELDERLIPLLTAFMEPYPNFRLIQGDAMTVDLREAAADLAKPLSVVANIPYYITTPLITRLLTCGLPLKRMALMVQKEVADKLLAAPGEEGWGMLALRAQWAAVPRVAAEVPREAFTPPPKVDSTFVVLDMRPAPPVPVRNEAALFRVASAAFALRRKTMANALAAAFRLERAEAAAWLERAGVDPMVRGEKLGFEELAAIADLTDDFLPGEA